MGTWPDRYSQVPWWLPDSDLREANNGDVDMERHVLINGRREWHVGLQVWG